MSLHRRAAKRDKNEAGIVKVLRAHGCVVWLLSGSGVPDLLVMRKGRTWLADVKDGNGKATPAQSKAWEEAATKARVAVFVLRSPADAVAMLNSALAPWEPDANSPAPTGQGKLKGASSSHNHRCAKNGCRNLRPCVVHDGTGRVAFPASEAERERSKEHLRKLASTSYTPPRSKSVDAAKEAEVFAPPPSKCHADSDGDCGWEHCPQESNNRANYQSWCPLAARRSDDDD